MDHVQWLCNKLPEGTCRSHCSPGPTWAIAQWLLLHSHHLVSTIYLQHKCCSWNSTAWGLCILSDLFPVNDCFHVYPQHGNGKSTDSFPIKTSAKFDLQTVMQIWSEVRRTSRVINTFWHPQTSGKISTDTLLLSDQGQHTFLPNLTVYHPFICIYVCIYIYIRIYIYI